MSPLTEQDLLKMTRVRVLRGFQCYQSRAEAQQNDISQMRDHLPGAVVDLEEYLVLGELHIGRVARVDPDTPLSDGYQPVTRGADDEDARDQATLARAEAAIQERIDKAVADALAKAKK